MESTSRHQCLIYDGAPSLKLPLIATILKRRLDEGYRCLYLNSSPMVAGMRSTLSAMGINVAHEVATVRLILSSEPVTTNGEFNSRTMLKNLEDSIDQAIHDGYKGLWATGDMTWEFGPEKNFSKLLEYEMGLEELFQKRKELSGICQYHQDTLPKEVILQGVQTHPGIVINETLTRINPHYLKPDLHPELKNTPVHVLEEILTALRGLQGGYG